MRSDLFHNRPTDDESWKRFLSAEETWQTQEIYSCIKCGEKAKAFRGDPKIIGCVRCQITANPTNYENNFKKQTVQI